MLISRLPEHELVGMECLMMAFLKCLMLFIRDHYECFSLLESWRFYGLCLIDFDAAKIRGIQCQFVVVSKEACNKVHVLCEISVWCVCACDVMAPPPSHSCCYGT